MIRFQLIFYVLINLLCDLYAQNNSELIKNYTHQDTLRGSITAERSWWDLTYYDLELSIDPKTKTIYGHNTVHYKVIKKNNSLQIDLQPPMSITKVTQNGITLDDTRKQVSV